MTLAAAKRFVDSLPNDMAIAARTARNAKKAADRIEEQTLIAGALPGDFRVVFVITRDGTPWRTEIR